MHFIESATRSQQEKYRNIQKQKATRSDCNRTRSSRRLIHRRRHPDAVQPRVNIQSARRVSFESARTGLRYLLGIEHPICRSQSQCSVSDRVLLHRHCQFERAASVGTPNRAESLAQATGSGENVNDGDGFGRNRFLMPTFRCHLPGTIPGCFSICRTANSLSLTRA